jgi:hypothetical protein
MPASDSAVVTFMSASASKLVNISASAESNARIGAVRSTAPPLAQAASAEAAHANTAKVLMLM